MALLFGPSLAREFCASAPLAARTRAITATDNVRIVTSFSYPPDRQCPIRGQVPPVRSLIVSRVQKAMRHEATLLYRGFNLIFDDGRICVTGTPRTSGPRL